MFNRDNTITKENADETDFNTEFSHGLSLEFASYNLSGEFTVKTEYPESRTGATKSTKKGSRRQVDHAIRLANGTRILALEGKRLHDPKDKQYVIGNTGGIARFKRGDHGKELGFACLIGYVQQEAFGFWQNKVNQWIRNEISSKGGEIQWDESEYLSLPIPLSQSVGTCQSIHSRLGQGCIDLKHYWVYV